MVFCLTFAAQSGGKWCAVRTVIRLFNWLFPSALPRRYLWQAHFYWWVTKDARGPGRGGEELNSSLPNSGALCPTSFCHPDFFFFFFLHREATCHGRSVNLPGVLHIKLRSNFFSSFRYLGKAYLFKVSVDTRENKLVHGEAVTGIL